MVKPLMDKPPKPEQKKTGRMTLIRQYELITPLFGGGVEANVVDKTQPIRGTAVRGHLRFWWRATRGLKYAGNWERLKVKEDNIWGTTEQSSKIAVTVIESSPGKPYVLPRNRDLHVGSPRSPLGYVAFPLNQNREEIHEDVTFTLRIDCPKSLRPELKAALWAWETFGGIGARTRRGFGALHCANVNLRIDDKKYKSTNWEWAYSYQNAAAEIVNDIVHKFEISGAPLDSELPGLSRDSRRTHCTPAQDDAMSAWQILIDSLKNFRQHRMLNAQRRHFGRSYWPEPDAIRNLTGQSLPGHAIPVNNAPPIDEKFPRAAFGLPIVFEFKDGDRSATNRDPRKTELKGIDFERRASRLILRPLKCVDGRYVGLATILQGQTIPPGGLELKNSPRNPITGAENLDPVTESPQIRANHPDYNGKQDILQAFLDQLPRK